MGNSLLECQCCPYFPRRLRHPAPSLPEKVEIPQLTLLTKPSSLESSFERPALRQDMIALKQADIQQDYELLQVLGRGSFGEVRRARHRVSQVERVVKVVRKKGTVLKPDYLAELQMLRLLDHPNIVRVVECYDNASATSLVTQPLLGRDLFTRIAEVGSLSEESAGVVLRQVLSGLSYCHSKRVVHRDVKPENIVFSSRRSYNGAKLIDFGEAQFLHEEHLTRRVGSAYYVAPEVLSKKYNEKCDVWSAGVVLFILLCGRPPFYGASSQEILARVASGKYSMAGQLWSSVSDPAKDLVSRMLTFDPAQRPSAQECLRHQFFNCARGSLSTRNRVEGQRLVCKISQLKKTTALAEAISLYIVNFVVSSEELEKMASLFAAIDLNGDGKLSPEEMRAFFQGRHGAEAGEEECARVMRQLDPMQTGFVDYSKFVAFTAREQLLTEERLRQTFKLIDRDQNGRVDGRELQEALGLEGFQGEWDFEGLRGCLLGDR